jgi:hypothetical protein
VPSFYAAPRAALGQHPAAPTLLLPLFQIKRRTDLHHNDAAALIEMRQSQASACRSLGVACWTLRGARRSACHYPYGLAGTPRTQRALLGLMTSSRAASDAARRCAYSRETCPIAGLVLGKRRAATSQTPSDRTVKRHEPT